MWSAPGGSACNNMTHEVLKPTRIHLSKCRDAKGEQPTEGTTYANEHIPINQLCPTSLERPAAGGGSTSASSSLSAPPTNSREPVHNVREARDCCAALPMDQPPSQTCGYPPPSMGNQHIACVPASRYRIRGTIGDLGPTLALTWHAARHAMDRMLTLHAAIIFDCSEGGDKLRRRTPVENSASERVKSCPAASARLREPPFLVHLLFDNRLCNIAFYQISR